jgi:hypothetical protein
MTILFIAAAVSAISTAVLAFTMQVSVNARLPENEQLSWVRWRDPSIGRLCELYDRYYPDNYLTPLLRVFYGAGISFGLAILIVSFMQK